MKYLSLITALILSSVSANSQNIDSLLAEPQTIELEMSTPQPRFGETFQISLEFNHLRANIFKSLFGKLELSTNTLNTDQGLVTINVRALTKGKNDIGPLEFMLDKTKYTTNKVAYEVVDPLPKTDKGLWFRKVKISDSKFCIIIDQRIPAKSKTTVKKDKTTVFTTEPESENIVRFKNSYFIDGLTNSNSQSNSTFDAISDKNGNEKKFMTGYCIYYFTITDKTIPIKITKDKFDNIPSDYKFEDIVIQ